MHNDICINFPCIPIEVSNPQSSFSFLWTLTQATPGFMASIQKESQDQYVAQSDYSEI